jgi:hypothetical protein
MIPEMLYPKTPQNTKVAKLEKKSVETAKSQVLRLSTNTPNTIRPISETPVYLD